MRPVFSVFLRRAQWLLLAVLLCGGFAGHGAARAPRNQGRVDDEQERRALLDLFDATNGNTWQNTQLRNQPWDPADVDFSAWYGVIVTDGDVTAVNLVANNLEGYLPGSLANLEALQELRLTDNSLHGDLPAEFGTLAQLTVLDVSQNQLHGTIPADWGSLAALTVVNLSHNELEGDLPLELQQWSALLELSLGHNRFTGDLQDVLAGWPLLERLDLQANNFTGDLPATLFDLTSLQYLTASDNQFTGGVLTDWSALQGLQHVDLARNQFTGGLPVTLGLCVSLREVYLAGNQFTGPLPAAWAQVPLTVLDVSENALEGVLPPALLQLPSLTTLNVAHNRFVGALPPVQLAQGLVHWQAQHNRFTGPMPAGLGSLPHLQTLDLSHNQLWGELPAALGQATALTDLILANNRLTGPIPLSWTGLPALRQLDVSNNQLIGTIPRLAGTSAGARFAFANNHFSGLASYLGLVTAGQSTLVVYGNHLDPAALEANLSGPPVAGAAQHPFAAFDYAPQRPPLGADTVAFVRGATLQLHRQPAGAHNTAYQWQRDLGGAWSAYTGQTTPHLVLGQADDADQGHYRLAITNAWLPGLGLYTRAVYADLVPYLPLPENRPVDRAAPALADVYAPTTRAGAVDSVNYVRTFAPQTALTDPAAVAAAPVASVHVATEYFDGLGRPVQTVRHHATPLGRDLVQPRAYDGLGRETRAYLPYATWSGTERYHPDALYEQYHFYRDPALYPGAASNDVALTGVPFSETLFEPSPLHRPVAQAAPGEAWALPTGRGVLAAERANAASDSVQRFWGVGAAQTAPYAAGTLWGQQTTDEHGYRTIAWRDAVGQLVLKQVEAKRVKTPQKQVLSRWLRTYYAYDDFGLLRAVYPPEAVKELQTHSWQPTAASEKLTFRYRYDAGRRVVGKQVPGTDGETLLVYDVLDRPILSQDAAQRGRDEWAFTKYDCLGRPVYTGVGRGPGLTQAGLQAGADAAAQAYETRTDQPWEIHYYTGNQAYPDLGSDYGRNNPTTGTFAAFQVLTVNYYDDYNFNNDAAETPDAAYDAQLDGQFTPGPAPVPDPRVTGQLTRTRTRVLGVPASAPGAWLTTTTFYDAQARAVQVQSTNARGGADVVGMAYDFVGKVTQTVAQHTGPNHAPVRVREWQDYDAGGRLVATRQQVADEAQPVPIARLAYNELGQLTRKVLSTGVLRQNVDYRYNTRGWLTHLNDAALTEASDLFGLELCYERGFSAGYEQYNGNLTGQKWRSSRDGVERAYGYVYDPLNRLLQGDYVARAQANSTVAPWTAEAGNYRLSLVSYDDNGNIQTLRRRGLLAAATRSTRQQFGPVDHLAYAYDGNRLQAVDDLVTTNELPRPADYHGAPASLAGDFQEQGVRQAQEYFYDANGNLTQDRNKGITAIAYNYLNLPRRVAFGNGADSVVFRYAASGQKVAKLVYQTGRPVQRTDYLGAFQYEQDSLRFFPHAEGRVLRTVSAASGQVRYAREFTLKDHLGNLRLAYRAGQRSVATATLELSDPTQHAREAQQFDSLSVSDPVAVNVGVLARTGTYAARLNAAQTYRDPSRPPTPPTPIGPLMQLAVQKGDTVRVTAPGYYPQGVVSSSNFAFSLASFVASLVQAQPGPVPGDGRGQTRALPLLSLGVSAGLPALLPGQNGVPKGYLRLLVFDADSNLVTSQTQQLTTAAAGGYEELLQQVVVQQDGYVTAYVGNESAVDVYFDDVTVELRQGLQIQENQYDPFGLDLAGVSVAALGLNSKNFYQFNGKENQLDLGLRWNHQDARFFDYQIGRWHVVDPLVEAGQENWTPYQFGFDNAIRYNDPNGTFPGDPGDLVRAIGRFLKNAIAQSIENTIHSVVTGIKNDLKNALRKTTPYFTAEGKLWVGLRAAGEVKGLGVDVGQSYETSGTLEVNKSETTFETHGTKKSPHKVSTIAKVGVPTALEPIGVEGSIQQSREVSKGGKVLTRTREVNAGVSPLPGVLVGVGSGVTRNYVTNDAVKTDKVEVSSGVSAGLIIGAEINIAVGVKHTTQVE